MCVLEVYRCGCANPDTELTECELRHWQDHVTRHFRSNVANICPRCTDIIETVHIRATQYADQVRYHLGPLSAKVRAVMGTILCIEEITAHEATKLEWAEQQLSFVNAAHKRVEEVERALAEGARAIEAYRTAAPNSLQSQDAFNTVCDVEARLKSVSRTLDGEMDPATFPQLAKHIEEVAQVSIQHDYVQQQLNRPASILRRICATCGQPGRCVCISRRERDELRASVEGPEPLAEDEVYTEAWHELNALHWEWEDEMQAQAVHGEEIDLYDGII